MSFLFPLQSSCSTFPIFSCSFSLLSTILVGDLRSICPMSLSDNHSFTSSMPSIEFLSDMELNMEDDDIYDFPEWKIEEIMMGDGSVSHGINFKVNRWYASAVQNQGVEHFFEVDVDTVKISSSIGDSFMFPARAVIKIPGKVYPTIACFVPKKRNTRLQAAGDRTHVIRGAVLDFCRKNPGVGVKIGGPGARTRNSQTSLHVCMDHGSLRATADKWDCVPASIINAIYFMGNKNETEKIEAEFNQESQRYTKIGQVGKKVQKIGAKLTIKKPNSTILVNLRDGKYDFAFDWLSKRTEGKYIVRLCEAGVVDHCIAIDANRGLILDSAEEYPLELSINAIRCCGGSEAQGLHVAEVFELVRRA